MPGSSPMPPSTVFPDRILSIGMRNILPRIASSCLVGDFQTEQALDLVKRTFETWPQGERFDDPIVPYQPSTTRRVYYVEKSDMTQAKIVIGHLGLMRNHPDYHPVVIINQILSGSFGARLFSSIRSQKGLAYDVHGGVGFGWGLSGNR